MKKLCVFSIAGLAAIGLSQMAHADATLWSIQMNVTTTGTNIVNSATALMGTASGASDAAGVEDSSWAGETINHNAADVLTFVSASYLKTDKRAPIGAGTGETKVWDLNIFREASASADATGTLNVWNPSANDIPNDAGAAAYGQPYSWTIRTGSSSGPVVFTFDPLANGSSTTPAGSIALGALPLQNAALHYYLVAAPVPEPGSLLALGAGAISLLGLIRRRSA